MMKKVKIDLRKTVIAISAVVALITGSIFLLMYADNKSESSDFDVEGPIVNSFVLTPDNMCSYGELMFAYIGENNYLYNLDDESKPLIEQAASILLYASDDTVIYIAPTEINADHHGREYIIQELQIGEHENNLYTIATVTTEPCWSSNDEVVYFAKDGEPTHLYTFEPLTSTIELAAEFEENIIGLRISSDGLLVTLESGREMLYVPLSKSLTDVYYDCQGSRVLVCEQYDLILTPSGELSYRWLGSNDSVKIADNVIVAKGYQDNEIFFLQNTSEGNALYAYYVSEEVIVELAKIPENVMAQLTVSADYAFLIDDNNVVYKYDIDLREFYPFSIIDTSVKNPMISVFDYRLMIYDLAREIDQTFVTVYDATATPTESSAAEINEYINEKSEVADGSSMHHSLGMASIGTEVQELQISLINLGYLDRVPTGIYDLNTTIAVQLLQHDLGMNESGIANSDVLSRIAEGSITIKSAYSPLSLTSTGITVRDLQARLNALGYRVASISGTMDVDTISAMQMFASVNGMEYNGGIIRTELLDALFANNAAKCDSYVLLQIGDCHVMITELNQRLKDLHYLAGSVNPSFDSKTMKALDLVCKVNGIEYTACDASLQAFIYGNEILECPDELKPIAADDTTPSTPNQVISDRQLKIIRKWLTKQFAVNHTDKQAIKRLQMQLVRLGYLPTDFVSMVYDQNTFDAILKFQNANEIFADGIASKTTLTEIFRSEINSSIEDTD